MVESSRQIERRKAAQRHGVLAEQHVTSILRNAGWTVLAQNWSGGGAELDIVVGKPDALRFVEVKARTTMPEDVGELLPLKKRRRLVRGAEAYMTQHPTRANDIAFMLALVSGKVGELQVTLMDDPFDGVL